MLLLSKARAPEENSAAVAAASVALPANTALPGAVYAALGEAENALEAERRVSAELRRDGAATRTLLARRERELLQLVLYFSLSLSFCNSSVIRSISFVC